MIKAVIFDLGGVFVNADISVPIQNLTQYLSGKIHGKTIYKDLYYTGLIDKNDPISLYHRRYHLGILSTEEYFKKIKKHIGFADNLTLDIFRKIYPNRFTLIDGMYQLLKNLESYRRYMLSDINEMDITWLIEQFPELFREFDQLFFSHEYSVDKHTVVAWKNVMKVSKLQPNEHVFIDDKAPFVESAIKIGMKGIVFENATQLEKDLQEIGVRFSQ